MPTAIYTAIAIWLIQRVTVWAYTYYKAKRALLRDMANHALDVVETVDFIELLTKSQAPKTTPKRSGTYYSRGYVVYERLLPFVLSGFTDIDFTRVQTYYSHMKEFDELAAGFLAQFNEWRHDKRELSVEDIAFLGRKLDRLTGYRDYFRTPPRILRDLDSKSMRYVSPTHALAAENAAGNLLTNESTKGA